MGMNDSRKAVALMASARYGTAFTGGGIFVESGVPPFRGEGGINYDLSQHEKSEENNAPRLLVL